ncbi:60S ribosomal protein L4B [Mucor velutinosus]|uniref:60S ribosomal protein L4B n=1 Tax=Mucor velutinosus TaxID=708070 RepID=A0AAN7DTF5_9FUNG|nr:60S ribosomal protein L4B [Mucor velutinosus]
MNRTEISIDNIRVLDIFFLACNTIGVLLRDAYLPELQSKLQEIDSPLIQNFDPLDHNHIADRKYQDLSEDCRIQLANVFTRVAASALFISSFLISFPALPSTSSIRDGYLAMLPKISSVNIFLVRNPTPLKPKLCGPPNQLVPLPSPKTLTFKFLLFPLFIVVPEGLQLSIKIKVFLMGRYVCVVQQHGQAMISDEVHLSYLNTEVHQM